MKAVYPPTIKFYTLGCKVNQYDTQSMRERFNFYGFKEVDNGQKASLYVINTCTVTHRADSDSLNSIRRAKRENPAAKIIVTGCLAELDEDKIKNIKGVSLIVKNKDKEKITQYLSSSKNRAFNKSENKGISYFKGHTRAFLKIQDGCNNYCAYCKVPLVRGRSKSKPLNQIITEARNLVKNGFKEIVLSGICLGSYGKDLRNEIDLVRAIEALEEIEGLLRIRLSSIEAVDVSMQLINRMARSSKLCPHLHIPVQSGDDKILNRMNRRNTRGQYLKLIKRIKDLVPQVAITTDVLVGFPGETEENFQNTINLIRDILPLRVHIFPYSPRKHTYAAGLTETISVQVVNKRISRLKNIAEKCAFSYKEQFLHKTLPVLIEARSKDYPGFWVGYTDNYIKVLVQSAENLENRLIPVKIKKISCDCVFTVQE